MHKNAIITGALLFLLGPIFYFLQKDGSPSATAFIPSVFGIFIAAFGLAAANPSRTKAAMHGAAAFGLIGLLGSLMSARKWPALLTGQVVERPLAAWEQLICFGICAVFVGACVNWFLKNRRARLTG